MVAWLLQCMQFTTDVNSITRTGIWEDEEKRRLLFGIFLFGHGKWKSIQLVVSTRDYAQVNQKGSRLPMTTVESAQDTGESS